MFDATTNSDLFFITLEKADVFSPPQKFDCILANINKNVILANAQGLVSGLQENGILLLSGLLKEDEDDVLSAFAADCIHLKTVEKNNWICLLLKYGKKT